jgi:ribulose-bisphosphate carboxylase large chain
MGAIRPIFPAPGGGMSLDRLHNMRAIYGREAILLIGGGLRQHGPDVVENCRYFAKLAQEI